MRIRVLAMALALLIGGVPGATAVCQAICAGRDTAAATGPEHRSCHAHSPSNDSAVTGVDHACCRSDGDDRGTSPTIKSLAKPAVVARDAFIEPSLLQLAPAAFARVGHSPPRSPSSCSPLRI
jgi:hypothetical protein